MDKVPDAVRRVALARHQRADVRKDLGLLMLEVGLHLALVLLEETDEHLGDAALQVLGDGIQVALDVGQTLVNIILVGLFQIRYKTRHVGSQYRCRGRHIVIERVDVADEQEETGVHTAALAHVGNRTVAETQRNAQTGQQGKQ